MIVSRSSQITHPGVRQAIQAFEKLQEDFAEYGAGDSEPDAVFQWTIAQELLMTREPLPPLSAWQLSEEAGGPGFLHMPAMFLRDTAQDVKDAIKLARDTDHLGEWEELYDQLQAYCWRWDFETVANQPPAWHGGGYKEGEE